MRKILLVIPFLFAPALAGASHPSLKFEAAYDLNVRAAMLSRSVASMRGNKQLKREAREFRRASNRLARQLEKPRKKRKLVRALSNVNRQFADLRYAVRESYAPPRVKRRIRRQLRGLSMAIMDVEFAINKRGRYARSWSSNEYAFRYDDQARRKGKWKKGRH